MFETLSKLRQILNQREMLHLGSLLSAIIIMPFAQAVGVASIFVSAFATWLKMRFVWMNNHRLSRRLLDKHLSRPYAFSLNKNNSELSNNVLPEVNQLTGSNFPPCLQLLLRVWLAY